MNCSPFFRSTKQVKGRVLVREDQSVILLVKVGQLPYLLPGKQHLDELYHQRLISRRSDDDLERLVVEQIGKSTHSKSLRLRIRAGQARPFAHKITKSFGIIQGETGPKRGFLLKISVYLISVRVPVTESMMKPRTVTSFGTSG